MGNWNIYGILLGIGVFFTVFGFILAQLNMVNPLTGEESSFFAWLLGLIIP